MELGCGTGNVSLRLAPRLGEIVGVDSSEKMIHALDRKIRASGIENVRTRMLDPESERLSFPRPFDLVFSSMVLLHMREPGRLLHVLHANMLPGGTWPWRTWTWRTAASTGISTGSATWGFPGTRLGMGWRTPGSGTSGSGPRTPIAERPPQGDTTEYPVFLMTARAYPILPHVSRARSARTACTNRLALLDAAGRFRPRPESGHAAAVAEGFSPHDSFLPIWNHDGPRG